MRDQAVPHASPPVAVPAVQDRCATVCARGGRPGFPGLLGPSLEGARVGTRIGREVRQRSPAAGSDAGSGRFLRKALVPGKFRTQL